MKFGIDYQAAMPRQRSGIGNYIYNFVEALSAIDTRNDYRLFISRQQPRTISLNKNYSYQNKWNPSRWLESLDVFHGPDFKLMTVRARKKIVTIHDLASCMNNDYMSIDFEKLTKKKIERSMMLSDVIITVSQAVKMQIEELYPGARGRIEAIHHGISDEITHISDAVKVRNSLLRYNLRQPYLLFVGNIENRKNIATLLKAFRILIDDQKLEHDLILVGKPGWGYRKIENVRQELNLAHRTRFVGWVEEGDLAAIYTAADLFVYPSWYEGFGFPILEAMKCRVPVVCSDIPAHKEIAGEAAMFVRPGRPESLADAIRSIVSDSAMKNLFIEKGIQRVKSFRWDRTATEILKIYEG